MAGGERAIVSEQVDTAFHSVALPVEVGFERGQATTGPAFRRTMSLLIGLDRDSGSDLAATRVQRRYAHAGKHP